MKEGHVHVWTVNLDEECSLGRARSLLSRDELARADGFQLEHARRRFAIARAVLRTLLAQDLGASPRELTFAYGARGKPRLDGVRLRFNLSHSHGLALVALALDREIGVDVEKERDIPDALAIAERMFAPAEYARLVTVPAADRVPAFLRCWTRKEAFVKATGDGLGVALDAFEVTFATADEPARFVRVNGVPETEQPFRLTALAPAAGSWAALCLEGARWSLSCQARSLVELLPG